jgi:hypothetical protein
MPDLQLTLELVMRMLQARAELAELTSLSAPVPVSLGGSVGLDDGLVDGAEDGDVGDAAADDAVESSDEIAAIIGRTLGEGWAFWLSPRPGGRRGEANRGGRAPEDLLDSMRAALLRWGGEPEKAQQIEEAWAVRKSGSEAGEGLR